MTLLEAIVDLNINQIVVDLRLQPRVEGIDPDHVQALQAVPESWPPLAVVCQGSQYLLLDGFHRLAAAQNLGLDTVPVRVLEPPADGDLEALAFDLNAAHGRPLSLSDRRAFAVRLLRRHPDWSDREIGRRSGLSQPPVAKLREELEARAEIAPTETRVGRGGVVYRVGSNSPSPLPPPESPGGPVTPDQRHAQRRIAQYLERLAGVFRGQDALDSWETSKDAAEACRLVFGPDKAADLAQDLGNYGLNVVDVARALGYVEPAE
jgi:hypothetical protein